jgi:hypothetical protein
LISLGIELRTVLHAGSTEKPNGKRTEYCPLCPLRIESSPYVVRSKLKFPFSQAFTGAVVNAKEPISRKGVMFQKYQGLCEAATT